MDSKENINKWLVELSKKFAKKNDYDCSIIEPEYFTKDLTPDSMSRLFKVLKLAFQHFNDQANIDKILIVRALPSLLKLYSHLLKVLQVVVSSLQ